MTICLGRNCKWIFSISWLRFSCCFVQDLVIKNIYINDLNCNLCLVNLLQIYSEIIMSRKGAQKQKQQNVDKMLVLLATVYESARLMPAGPLLQRCSLKHGMKLLASSVSAIHFLSRVFCGYWQAACCVGTYLNSLWYKITNAHQLFTLVLKKW